jgi:hypothetical protein
VAKRGRPKADPDAPLDPNEPLPGDEEVADMPKVNETVPGGKYIRGARLAADGNHYGGEIVNAEGEVLATFGPKDVNTGEVEDGTPPETPEEE